MPPRPTIYSPSLFILIYLGYKRIDFYAACGRYRRVCSDAFLMEEREEKQCKSLIVYAILMKANQKDAFVRR